MWKTFRAHGRALAILLILHAGAACTCADASRRHFDIDGQSAASALNEFARQADIALIFSYDNVAGTRTQPLRGRYTVEAGLGRLLVGTGLEYRQIGDTYLVCPPVACAVEDGIDAPESDPPRASNGGKRHGPRLNDKPVTVPGRDTPWGGD